MVSRTDAGWSRGSSPASCAGGRGFESPSRYQKVTEQKVVCEVCGRPFVGLRRSRKYCSDACRYRRNGERKAARYASDTEYRERRQARERQRYAENHEVRERKLSSKRTPEFLERRRRYENERYASDPEFREGKLDRKVRRRRAMVDALLERDDDLCSECGELLVDPFDATEVHIDHIKPVSKGGATVKDNLQLLHAVCNHRKYNHW